nr:hypothetical protein [Bacteroidota bacterium]
MKATITFIIAVFLLCLIPGLNAQNMFELHSGKPFLPTEGEISTLFDRDDDNFYFLRLTDKSYLEFNSGDPVYVEVFGKDLNHRKSIELKLPGGAKYRRLIPVSFFKLSDGFIILSKYYSTSDEDIEAFLLKTNLEGQVINEIISPGIISNVMSSVKDFHFFELHRINDGNEQQFYVFSLMTPPEMDMAERINFIIYDDKLNNAGTRLVSFPGDHLDYKFSKPEYGPTGHVFFHIEIRNPYMPDRSVHQLIIYSLFTDNNRSYEFKLEDGLIEKAQILPLDEDKIGFFGTYKSGLDDKIPKGIFYYIFDAGTGILLRQTISELSNESLELMDPKTHESKSKYKDLIPQKLCIDQDGNIFMVMEYFRRSMLLIHDYDGKMYNKPVFYANELFILSFDRNDQMGGAAMIPKQQFSRNKNDFIGFDAFLQSGKVILIYNDHPKNANEYNEHKLKIMKAKFDPMLIIYDPGLKTYTKHILKFGDDINYSKERITRVSKNTLLWINPENKFNLNEITFLPQFLLPRNIIK